MKEGMEALSEAVSTYRKQECLSQDRLADWLNFSKRTINNMEAATDNSKMDTLFPLIKELHIDANRVFYPEIHQGKSALSEFTYIFTYTKDEIRDLYVIYKTVLSTLSEYDSRKIKHNFLQAEL